MIRVQLLWVVIVLWGCAAVPEEADVVRSPEVLLAEDASLASPGELEVISSKTSTVFLAEKGEWQFNLHSYLVHHDGKFWAMWSSGRVDEDSRNQLIRYATSEDGHTWSESGIVADDPDGPDQPGRWIARGVFVFNGKLTALLAYIEEKWANLRLMRFEWTGDAWTEAGLFVDNCMNNYPPRPIGDRMFMTCRDSDRKMYPAISDTLAGTNWTVTPLPGEPPHDKMSEPSWYVDPEGLVHLIFRDQNRSRFLYRSISRDQGQTWPAPVRTNYPDATSKNFTGLLSNGWYYLINNPSQTGRDPLGISFSRDGWTFGSPKALRKDAPPQRFPGRAKGPDSFQYPHAIEYQGSLWVIYSTNKEDIEISEYKISDFGLIQ